MYRSKLQKYTQIICNLASNGPMKLTKLCEKVDINEVELKHHLKILINSDLVDEEDFGRNKIFYTVKEKGITVLEIIYPVLKKVQNIQRYEIEAITTKLLMPGYR